MLKQVGVGVVDESVSSFAVKIVCGVRRDSENNIQVAVVWEDDDTKDGGTWIELDDLNVLFTEDQADSDTDEDRVPTPKEQEQSMQDDISRYNWGMYFGRDLDEDLNVLVGFKAGRDTTVYKGVVLIPDFNDSAGLQHVHFPLAQADRRLGTAAQEMEKENIEIRLDTLDCTPAIDDCSIAFWVMSEYATLPFIKKGLPALKIIAPEVRAAKRRKKRDSHTDSYANDGEPHKRTKTVMATAVKKTGLKKLKKKSNKENTAELMSQMRNTPVL